MAPRRADAHGFRRMRCVALLLFLAGVPPAFAETYAAHGVVRGVDVVHRQVLVAHDAIPGYMAAMTMSFDLREEAELGHLQPGDRIDFDLVVRGDDAWIEHVQRTGFAGLPQLAPAPITSRAFEPGDLLPDIAFTDDAGRIRRLAEFRGRVLVVTFIYTRCPLPTYCPLMERNLQSAQTLLQRLGAEDGWHFLSLSFDAAHDTPAVLADYARTWRSESEAARARWTFAAAEPADVHALGDGLGLEFREADGAITHSLRTVVIDPHGRLRRSFAGNSWTPQELASAVRRALRE
jgi:protein SCO1/2